MKKVLLFAFLFWGVSFGYAQLVLSTGSQLVVNGGSVVVANNVTNNGGSITNNEGTVEIKGHLQNNTSGLMNPLSDGIVKFNGSSAQEIYGDFDAAFYGTVEIDNSAGVSIKTSTGHDQTINGTLTFTDGLFTLNEFDLTLTSAATGFSADKYVQTNGDGALKSVVEGTAVIFPVGTATFNPVTLTNAGTSDTYGVVAKEGLPDSFTGTTHIVDRSWVVSEAVPDGSDLTVTTQWNSGEELSDFDPTKSCVGFTTDEGIDVAWSASGDAGSGPYSRSTTGITSVGTFMVGDDYYGEMRLDLKVILAAAWNGVNMDKKLNTASLIPLSDPYGVGVTVTSLPATAVDWVKVELRNSSNRSSVTKTYAKLVDVNGQIIEEDGSNMKVTGFSGTYFVAVKHRNHLGVVTNAVVELMGAPVVNFTNSQSAAWQSGASNTAMLEVETDSEIFGLWSGNANGDASIVYNGGNSDRVEILDAVGGVSEMSTVISGVYSGNDINMDGNIVYNGGGSDRVIILDNVGGVSEMSTTLSANLPD